MKRLFFASFTASVVLLSAIPVVAADNLVSERNALAISCNSRLSSCMSACRHNIRQSCEICRINHSQCMRHVPIHRQGS